MELCAKIKSKFGGDCNIIEVLPKENISKIGFQATSFYSVDVREMASFIANMQVFISADSGIMHSGSAAQTPVVGLFSRTNIDEYQPYNPGSISLDTNFISDSEIVSAIEDILDSKKIDNEITLLFRKDRVYSTVKL